MGPISDFPAKLGLMLHGASLSRVALAQKLGVDKSLVSRWLSGAVQPTDHNLSRLSMLLSEALPGFRTADWLDDAEALARRYNLPFAREAGAGVAMPGPLAAFLESAGPELAYRGAAYEGFWRTSRPSLLVSNRIFHDYGLLRRGENGLIEVHMRGSGLEFNGWLFPVAGNVFSFLFDTTGRTPLTVLFKGVSLPRATVLDGLLLMAALDADRTPVALPIVMERVGDLSGDRDGDMERYGQILEEQALPAEPLPDDVLEARLLRETGPCAAEMILSVSSAHSLSRGETDSGLKG